MSQIFHSYTSLLRPFVSYFKSKANSAFYNLQIGLGYNNAHWRIYFAFEFTALLFGARGEPLVSNPQLFYFLVCNTVYKTDPSSTA